MEQNSQGELVEDMAEDLDTQDPWDIPGLSNYLQ